MKENAERATTTKKGAASRRRTVGPAAAGRNGRRNPSRRPQRRDLHGAAGEIPDRCRHHDPEPTWAPACTLELFDEVYKPLCESGAIRAFDLYTLDDATERDDDCANIYHKSLLYLVSGAFETKPPHPALPTGWFALLGLERDAKTIARDFLGSRHAQVVSGPGKSAVHRARAPWRF